MKANLFRLIFVGALLNPLVGFAQTVVISDIDDTIKVSHVLDTWDSFRRAFSTESFVLMPEMYRLISSYGVGFFYVSNAPRELMEGSHSDFLATNAYPIGPLLLPATNERNGHKIREIEKILAAKNPQIVIFLGDNGEKDSEFYQFITNKYKNTGIRFLTYIRIDYDYDSEGTKPAPGQKTFVTPAEVALDLYAENLMSARDADQLLKSSLVWAWSPFESPSVFLTIDLPDWVDCSKHRPDLRRHYSFSPDVIKLEQKIIERCIASSGW